jgi:hypothetical protein
MDAHILQFPNEETTSQEQEMAPAKKIDWKWGITTGLVLLGMVVAATLAIWREFSSIDQHLARVETAVRIIGAKQGGDTKTLMDEALTVAMNDSKSGRLNGAGSVLNIANNLLNEQRESRVPAPQETFDTLLIRYEELKSIPVLRRSAHEGLTNLADYRSALIQIPATLPQPFMQNTTMQNGRIEITDALITGDHFLKNSPEGLSLDGLILRDVVFMDVDIYYHGGPFSMQNVRFINCRFHVRDSAEGTALLEATIEAQTGFNIG